MYALQSPGNKSTAQNAEKPSAFRMLYLLVMESPFSKRKVYLDVIRILAIFLVVYNHTSAYSVPFHHSATTLLGFSSLVISICDKMAVPLFFMISGALLLPKEESIKKIFTKRILRYLIVIILFQMAQHGYSWIIMHQTFTPMVFIKNCLIGVVPSSSSAWAVWFLYAYLAFLFMLPILRIMVKHMKNEHFIYLFLLQIAFCAFLPVHCTGCSSWLPFFNKVYLYVIAGYYIENRINIDSITNKWKASLCLASASFILISALMCELARRLYRLDYVTDNVLCFQGGLLIPCITLYLFVKCWFFRPISCKSAEWITRLGGATFTVMLCENMLRHGAGMIVPLFINLDYPAYPSQICIVILTCLTGLSIGLMLKQIPGIRTLV